MFRTDSKMGAKSKILRRRKRRKYQINKEFATELTHINGNNGAPDNGCDTSQTDPIRPNLPRMVDKRDSHSEDAPDMAASRPISHWDSDDQSVNNNHGVVDLGRDDGDHDLLRAAVTPGRNTSRKQASIKGNKGGQPGKTLPLHDETDLIDTSSELQFKSFDILINLFSIGSFLFDIGTDIFVAVLYLKEELYWYFGFTVAFICVPAIINTIFGLIWYMDDHRYYRDASDGCGEKSSKMRWIVRLFFLLFQIGPILRYIDVIIYGCKSWFCKDAKKKKHYEELMVNEDADAALLRLLECFVEAAPQLTLQLYVLCIHGAEENVILKIGQVLACFASLASLSWALVSYSRSLRMALADKANMRPPAMVLQFIWRFFTVGCRILCLSLFASIYGYWIFVFCGCHWLVMFVWMLWLKTNFCNSRCQEFFFNIVIAIVHIFCFVNTIEGHTRLRYILYYMIVYCENIGLTMGWYMFAHTEDIWYLETALVIIFVGFILGLLFQVLYYIFFHPNNYPPFHRHKRIQLWIPFKELWNPRTTKTDGHNGIYDNQHCTEGQKRMMNMSKHHHSNNQPYV